MCFALRREVVGLAVRGIQVGLAAIPFVVRQPLF